MSFIRNFKSISNLLSSKTNERSYDKCLVTNHEESITDVSDHSEHDLSLYVSASSSSTSVEMTPAGASPVTRQSAKKRDEFFHSLSLSPVDKAKKLSGKFSPSPRTRTTRNSKNLPVNSRNNNRKIQQAFFQSSRLRKSKKSNGNRISVFPDEVFVSSESESSFQGHSSKQSSPKNQERISKVHLKKQLSSPKLGTGNSPKLGTGNSPKLGTGKNSPTEKSKTPIKNSASNNPRSQKSVDQNTSSANERNRTIGDLAEELSSNQQGGSKSQSPAERFQPLSKPVTSYTLDDFVVLLKDFISDVECLMFGGGNSVNTGEMMVQLTAIKSYLRCNVPQAQKGEKTNFMKLRTGVGRPRKDTVLARKIVSPKRILPKRKGVSEVQNNRDSGDERAKSVKENTEKQTPSKSPKKTETAKSPQTNSKEKSNEPKRSKSLATIVNKIRTGVKRRNVSLSRDSAAEVNHIKPECSSPKKSTHEMNHQKQQESKSNKNKLPTTKPIKKPDNTKKKITLKTKKVPKLTAKVVMSRPGASTSGYRSQDKEGDLLSENVRRSSRVRFLPLKYWTSEKIKRKSDGSIQIESKKSYITKTGFITVKELKELEKPMKDSKGQKLGVGLKMVKSTSPKRKNTKVSSPTKSPSKVRKTNAILKQSPKSAKQSTMSAKQPPKSAKQPSKSAKQASKSAKQSSKTAKQSSKSAKQGAQLKTRKLNIVKGKLSIKPKPNNVKVKSPTKPKPNKVKGKSLMKPKPTPTTSKKVTQNSAITKRPLENTKKSEQTKEQTSSGPRGIKRQSKMIFNTPKHRKIESFTPNTSSTSSGGKRLLYSPEKWLDAFQQSFVCAQ